MPWRRRHFSLVKMTWTVKRRLSRTHVAGLLALALLLTVLLCFSRRDWRPGRSGPRENPLALAIRAFGRPRVDSGQNSSSLLKENGSVAAPEPSLSLSTQGHVMGPGDATSAPPYRYILNQPLKCKDRVPFLVLLVVAEPGQFDARNAIRQTWGNESAVAGQSFVRLFLLGTGSSSLQSRIEEESRTHGDIIQQDYQDTYKNLTIKTLMGMNWVATFCPNVSYVMKTDSDMFVNTERLIQKLLRPDLPPKQRFFTGYLMRGYAPNRNKDSKWFMAPELYPSERYPPFCSGTGYVFSGDMAGRIYGASRGVPLLHLEDVYVGVCLARLGIAPQPPPSDLLFHHWRVSYSSCTYRRLITSHHFQPGELLTYWRHLQADKHHACADTGQEGGRYMAIVHPLRPRCRCSVPVVIAVWAVPALVSVPVVLTSSLTRFTGSDGLTKTFCGQVWSVDQRTLYQTYFLSIMILQFLFPVVVMVICYGQVCRELWFKAVPGEQTPQVKLRLLRRRRTVLVLVLVLALYVLCWSPYYAFSVLRDFHGAFLSRQRHALTAFYAVDCLAMANGVFNTLCFFWVRRRAATRGGAKARSEVRLRSVHSRPSPEEKLPTSTRNTDTEISPV